MAATPQPTPHAEPSDFIANVPLELAHVLLRQCADFRSASSLLCLNRHWAIIALDDSSWQPLAVLIAKEACLHYVPVPPSCWRSDCEKLFANRGTFVDTFGGCTAPPPPAVSFSIEVGCRFRPPGGASENAVREVVLPLHQRLKLLQEAHGCSASEARRRLWADGASSKSDPFATAEAVDGSDASAHKENVGHAGNSSAGLIATVDDGDSVQDTKAETSSSAAGLISVGAGDAIVCAPGAGLRAFHFAHTWDSGAHQRDVYDDAIAPLVEGVLNGRSACVLAYGQTGAGKSHTMFGQVRDASHDGGAGVVPRALRGLLSAIETRNAGTITASVSLACIEVFGDEVTDLLATDGAARVGGFWHGVSAAATAAGYADTSVASVADAIDCLERAESSKRRAATAMNERSSRAHSLVIATVEQVCNLCPTISHSCLPCNLPCITQPRVTSCLFATLLGSVCRIPRIQVHVTAALPRPRVWPTAATARTVATEAWMSATEKLWLALGVEPPTKLGPTAA